MNDPRLPGECTGQQAGQWGKDCLQMNKIREKFQRFMIGRYGMDQLGQFIMYAVLVLVFLNVVVRVYPGAGGFYLPVLTDVFKKCGDTLSGKSGLSAPAVLCDGIFQENQIPFHGGPEIPHL